MQLIVLNESHTLCLSLKSIQADRVMMAYYVQLPGLKAGDVVFSLSIIGKAHLEYKLKKENVPKIILL